MTIGLARDSVGRWGSLRLGRDGLVEHRPENA